MSFQEDDYCFDRGNEFHEAEIKERAILYRLTSLSHNTPDTILNGRGPVASRQKGRFHKPDQLTTYCSNNVVVSLAEVLFHMYRDLLNQLGKASGYALIRSQMSKLRSLVVFRVRGIKELVHLDCEGVEKDYRTRISGTLSVWPDATYELFDMLNDAFRHQGKKGVFYPSARHAFDKCLVLFSDHSDRVIVDEFHCLQVRLQLIPEDQDLMARPVDFSPFRKKVHPTMGFYEIVERKPFEALSTEGWINPKGLPALGFVDFVRRRYFSYPNDAVVALA